MLKPPPSDHARAHESWAEVRAHDTVMRYHRSGAGRAVLVLGSLSDGGPLWPALLETLRGGYRLIVPEPPLADAEIAPWLAAFLEGLGISTVRIVAAGRFCVPSLELALRESDQVARIALVAPGEGTPDAGRGALETAMGRSVIPLLLLRGGHGADDAVSLIAHFLAEETAAPA
jgi:hypothetical protein